MPSGPGLAALPHGYVFPQTGLASFMTDWRHLDSNAMWSFRSSPFGSTSHALANQNAFNTFYGGKSIFYSSGHHISFTDPFTMLCHRATRAHNTILVDGMGQRIGVEGYGWIPRFYVGKRIGYVMGDAYNAYGRETSPLWLRLGAQSGVSFSPKNGWGDVPLRTFRRHIVDLGQTGYIFIYDELESASPASYTFMLHTVTRPMTVDKASGYVHVHGESGSGGASDAYILASGPLRTQVTDQFFMPVNNWLRADAKGVFKKYPNHWHFTAQSAKAKAYRFATIIYTHSSRHPTQVPKILQDGRIRVDNWIIDANHSTKGKARFTVRHANEPVSVSYESGQETIITEYGKVTKLRDTLPKLEI